MSPSPAAFAGTKTAVVIVVAVVVIARAVVVVLWATNVEVDVAVGDAEVVGVDVAPAVVLSDVALVLTTVVDVGEDMNRVVVFAPGADVVVEEDIGGVLRSLFTSFFFFLFFDM